MTDPRSAFGAPPQGGAASGPPEPDPRRPLDAAGRDRLRRIWIGLIGLALALALLVTAYVQWRQY
jgi:hypothetical protein